MEDLSIFDGQYTGTWYISEEEDAAAVVSEGFSKNTGRTKFKFDYLVGEYDDPYREKTAEVGEHLTVVGTLYSGEFSTSEVDLEFIIGPDSLLEVDAQRG
jgi:hypothetical protein